MNRLFHQLIEQPAGQAGSTALRYRDTSLSYASLHKRVRQVAAALQALGLEPGERVAIYLPKQLETVIGLLAVSAAGGIFVPVNPLLKPRQVQHILRDSGARILISATERLRSLLEVLPECDDLQQVIRVDAGASPLELPAVLQDLLWQDLPEVIDFRVPQIKADQSVAILYTSGSTGLPKGVEISHRNLVLGADSVCEYLDIRRDDRILALLPLSFDYGLSQLSTAFNRGACLVLMNYLLPRDAINLVIKEKITGLAAVPSLWSQLVELNWPEAVGNSLRYITSSGGSMPRRVLQGLQDQLPQTRIYLMYGLTEAFRSTYLPPEELARRPDSIGIPIPHAELSVRRPDGSECAPNEPGELVQGGPLVAKGYWNNTEATVERFRPGKHGSVVWSGDTVRRDAEGYFYFVGRNDEQIKTSGYRVSPTEVEMVIHESGLVREAVVVGIPHSELGQLIVAVVEPQSDSLENNELEEQLQVILNQQLPVYMQPRRVVIKQHMPRTPNGKPDRRALAQECRQVFVRGPGEVQTEALRA